MMNAVILPNRSSDFGAVQYNDNKISKDKGELLLMKNFPSHINYSSSQQELKNYFLLTAKNNSRIKNPQFHCTISARGREHSKEELTKVAEKFMDKMGYGSQPYIVVFHNDTANNHVHIVSSRVSVETESRINRDFEKLKAMTAMREILAEVYGIDHTKKLQNILSYSYSNESQLTKLLESSGYEVSSKEENLNVIHNGVVIEEIPKSGISYQSPSDEKRRKQIYAILNRYKDVYSNKVFAVNDRGVNSYTSELQHQLKAKFGLEIVFSNKDNKNPFGYTIIDHKFNAVYKGGDVMKMNNLFTFTDESINKKLFDLLTNYNIADYEAKKALIQFYKPMAEVKDFMLFANKKRVPYNLYTEAKSTMMDAIRNYGGQPNDKNYSILSYSGKHYAINSLHGNMYDLEKLVGEKLYSDYINGRSTHNSNAPQNQSVQLQTNSTNPYSLKDLLNLDSASGFSSGQDQSEEENKKRKRRKKR